MKNKNKQTKFPVARIKRIMQKDEEVGKVAQATPVVISKALELFLGMIVDEASRVTLDRGSKKVEAYHLKHAVETVDVLDFLKEIVEAVPDPSAGGTIDLVAEAAERAAAKKKAKTRKEPEPKLEDGESTTPKKRKKKEEGVGGEKGKGKGKGRGKGKVKEEEGEDEEGGPPAGEPSSAYDMDQDDDEPENGGREAYGRGAHEEDDDDWEG